MPDELSEDVTYALRRVYPADVRFLPQLLKNPSLNPFDPASVRWSTFFFFHLSDSKAPVWLYFSVCDELADCFRGFSEGNDPAYTGTPDSALLRWKLLLMFH